MDGFEPPIGTGVDFKNEVPAELCDKVFPFFVALVCIRFEDTLFSEIPISSFTTSAARFQHLKNKLSSQKVEQFLPDHVTLRKVSPLTHKKLLAWAKNRNLNCDWCLNFAVAAMRSWLFDAGAREFKFWRRAFPEDVSKFVFGSVGGHLAFNKRVTRPFSFKYKNISFPAGSWNFLLEEKEAWAERVKDGFKDYLNSKIGKGETPQRDIISRFDKELKKHIKSISAALKVLKRKGEVKSAPRRHDLYFIWAICYQVLGWRESDISYEFEVPKKTAADGINSVLKLIDLPRRDYKPGRKRGSTGIPRKLSIRQEANNKARLCRFVEALKKVDNPENRAAVARAIGISENHFRSVWVSDLLNRTSCDDYHSLLRRYDKRYA